MEKAMFKGMNCATFDSFIENYFSFFNLQCSFIFNKSESNLQS